MNRLEFSLADLRFRIESEPAPFPLRPPEEYECFMRGDAAPEPDAVYRAAVDTAPEAPSNPSGVIWDNDIWRTRHSGSDAMAIDIRDIQANIWRRAADTSSDFSRGTLWMSPPNPAALCLRPLYHPQDRAVILGRLCHLGGIMMHASSVFVDGNVLLFAGMSGAGKTTIGRLWQRHGALLLNDERTLIQTRNGAARAGASPWHGEENQVNPTTGPLAGIFFLRQASANQLRRLPIPEGIGRMMTTAFVPVFVPDGPALTVAACHRILETTPAYEMGFTPDGRALDACRTAIATAAS